MRRRLLLLLLILVTAACACQGVEDLGLIWTLEADRASYWLGEPIAVRFAIAHIGQEPVVLDESAFVVDALWGSLIIERIMPGGERIPVGADAPVSTPSPAISGNERDGSTVATTEARIIAPGDSQMLSLVDLHRYYPFLEPGDYAMRSFLIITIYQHPGDTAHVVVGSGRWRGLLSEEVVLRVELPEGVKPEEGAALRDARILQGSAIDVEESVAGYLAFADAVVSAHVRAAAAFWLGEAYLAMRAFEQAEDAYRLIATSYTESVFADYVEERLQEVEALRGSGS